MGLPVARCTEAQTVLCEPPRGRQEQLMAGFERSCVAALYDCWFRGPSCGNCFGFPTSHRLRLRLRRPPVHRGRVYNGAEM